MATVFAMTADHLSPSLRLGAHVGQQNMTMNEMRALWRVLDEHLDWISAWDHLYEAPPAGGTLPHYEALTVLGALAASTERAQIGCLVFYVGYRSPGVLAKAATTLDHITGGRFNLGLGSGWHEQEAKAFGYPFPSVSTRFDMLDEAATIIRSLLTKDRTTLHRHALQRGQRIVPAASNAGAVTHLDRWHGREANASAGCKTRRRLERPVHQPR